MIEECLWFAVLLLLVIVILEISYPNIINEGFSNLVSVGDSDFWAKFAPRRGDVSYDPTEEERGFVRDIRYFNDYTDVQRLGVNHDFCRIVMPEGKTEKDAFFACALAGTQGMSSTHFRSKSVRDGFELSRDDYMRDVLGDGRDAYCRILKVGENSFEIRCNPASDTGFLDRTIVDSNPPEYIEKLYSFYEGILFWLRLRDDMLDYAKNLTISTAGRLQVEENPPKRDLPSGEVTAPTHGLSFNGVNQFIRLGDTKDLTLGDNIQIRYMRAVSFWVYFEEFTNNAHIFDFGNGAGHDNVWAGIVGRGNAPASQQEQRPLLCGSQITIPSAPSGQQCVPETTPQELMETTAANVNEFQCPKPEMFGRIMEPTHPKTPKAHDAHTADLVYEVWDHQQRCMHIQVKNAIPLRKWVHIAITAASTDALKPDIAVYVNGKLSHMEPGGSLPQNNYTTNNYIGKSNWSNQDKITLHENRDELFKGKLFDFRGYNIPLNQNKIKDTIQWGRKCLGMD